MKLICLACPTRRDFEYIDEKRVGESISPDISLDKNFRLA